MTDMIKKFKAYVIERDEESKTQTERWKTVSTEDLMDGDVTIRVQYTTMNYKDALAITGKSPVVRRFPMVPGIDLAGEVIKSDAPVSRPGMPS